MSRSSLSSWRARRRPEAKGIYFKIAVIVVFLLSLLLVACGTSSASNPVSSATVTSTQPTSSATASTQPTPTKVVDNFDPKNFYTSRNPDLALDVFGTLSTDSSKMDLVVEGNVSTPWHITSIDSTLSADPSSGTAQPGDNYIKLTASNSQANLPAGMYQAKISFKPVNPNPNEPKPATVPLTVHQLPTLDPLTAPVSGGTPIVLTSDDPNRLLVSVSFGSAIVNIPSYIGNSVTLTSPPAQNPGTVSITITVQRHDRTFMSFTLPDPFTYTTTATPTTPPPTPTPTPTTPPPTPTPTTSTSNIHTTRGKITVAFT
jgi:hypothetical protein